MDDDLYNMIGINPNSLSNISPASHQSMVSMGLASPNSWMDSFANWGSGLQQGLQRSGVIGSIDPTTKLKTDGWGSLALGTLSGLGSAYMGMKQYGLMKDQFKFQKDSFNKNYAAQRNLINSELEDRQRQRVRENPNTAMPVDKYMAQYGVKA